MLAVFTAVFCVGAHHLYSIARAELRTYQAMKASASDLQNAYGWLTNALPGPDGKPTNVNRSAILEQLIREYIQRAAIVQQQSQAAQPVEKKK